MDEIESLKDKKNVSKRVKRTYTREHLSGNITYKIYLRAFWCRPSAKLNAPRRNPTGNPSSSSYYN